MKWLKVLCTSAIVACMGYVSLLWATKLEWLPSQSAFALSENAIWYYFMHFSIMFAFFMMWMIFSKLKKQGHVENNKPWLYLLPVITGAGVVIFDMYNWPKLHNIFTAALFITASLSLILNAKNRDDGMYIFACGVSALIFLLGVVSNVHLFFAEATVEFILGTLILDKIWEKNIMVKK